jgi:segregation and condensation protein A
MKMKDAAEVLERRTVLDRDVFTRPPADFGQEDPAPPGDDLVEASLFDLIDAFRRVVGRAPADSGLKINIETKTMGQRVAEIVAHLKRRRQAAFTLLCRDDRTRMDLVLSFLAVLELARVGRLKLYQHTATGELTLFYVERADPEEPEPDWERQFGDASG